VHGSGTGIDQSPVLSLFPIHGHGSEAGGEPGVESSAQCVQGVGSGLLQGPTDALAESRIKMITAVRRYLHEPTMKHVDFYAGGVPKYRAELLKFAAWVAKNGEPKWFDRPEGR
jgi:hypothetical protein